MYYSTACDCPVRMHSISSCSQFCSAVDVFDSLQSYCADCDVKSLEAHSVSVQHSCKS
jgi:hypothetical protein